jgi:hypothetical protein
MRLEPAAAWGLQRQPVVVPLESYGVQPGFGADGLHWLDSHARQVATLRAPLCPRRPRMHQGGEASIADWAANAKG